jgi:hypothetical protein
MLTPMITGCPPARARQRKRYPEETPQMPIKYDELMALKNPGQK